MPSKYVDSNAIIQVIGCIYNAPHLLDQEDKYNISEDVSCEQRFADIFLHY